MADDKRPELDPEELDRQEAAALPGREEMSILALPGDPTVHIMPAITPPGDPTPPPDALPPVSPTS